jgi:hypothetical protein
MLYLRVRVGNAAYLIAAEEVAGLYEAENEPDPTVPTVDCRPLFAVAASAPGYRVRIVLATGEAMYLIVDGLDGLVVLEEDAFRPLPAIGRLGMLFDAVAVPVSAEPPALRLRARTALVAGAPLPPGEANAGAADR